MQVKGPRGHKRPRPDSCAISPDTRFPRIVHDVALGLTAIVLLGVAAQLVAWRLRMPSILILLAVGFFAGPITDIVDPEALLGELLFPIVSLSVAVILFEGGLSLDIAELRDIGRVVRNLITAQVLFTWIGASVLAFVLLNLSPPLASLLGAVLTVTGPTVIGPLLRQIRPEGRVGDTVKWEGIVSDPIGAILAVLVFEAIAAGGLERGLTVTALGVLKAVLVGTSLGLLGAALIVAIQWRHWIPDFLQNPTALAVVLAAFTGSNLVQPESGLLAVTMMGIALASQKLVSLKHIVEFKEVLRVLLISALFIILTARLPLPQPDYTSGRSYAFLAGLVLLIRPAAVALGTWRSGFTWQERTFLALMAPRGIVAAAVASLFALRLAEQSPEAARLAPLTFMMIAGTVAFYGATAPWAARRLGLATPRPQGLLLIGAVEWVRALAATLEEVGIKVVLADANWRNVTAARRAGLKAHYVDALSEQAVDELDLGGIGRVLALTQNDEVNALSTLHFSEDFGRSNVYQLPTGDAPKGGRQQSIPTHLRGRTLFANQATHEHMTSRFQAGATIKKTRLTDEFDYDAYRAHYGESALPLMLVKETGDVIVMTATAAATPKRGQTLVSLVDATTDATA
ncbi:MAG: cation:proton antiporter [Gemmatimonadales bacterium]